MSIEAEATIYCAVHHNRETSLRCNKCERYMCVQCAVQTPVGYRCRECTRSHEKQFFRASNVDALIVFGICAMLGGGAAFIMNLGSIFFAIFLGVPVGAFVGQLALRLVKGRRGRYYPLWGVLGTIVGAMLMGMISMLIVLLPTFTDPQYGGLMLEEVATNSSVQFGFLFLGALINIPLLISSAIVSAGVYGRLRLK
jgi:hypothetical protein